MDIPGGVQTTLTSQHQKKALKAWPEVACCLLHLQGRLPQNKAAQAPCACHVQLQQRMQIFVKTAQDRKASTYQDSANQPMIKQCNIKRRQKAARCNCSNNNGTSGSTSSKSNKQQSRPLQTSPLHHLPRRSDKRLSVK